MIKADKYKAYGAAVTAMLFWSFTFIWYKQVFLYYRPLTVIFLRLIIAINILWLFGSPVIRKQKLIKGDFKYFLLLAFFEPFLYFLGESFGMQYVTPTIGAIIISTIPLMTPVFAWIFLAERLNRFQFTGIILSFLGVFLIIFNNSNLNASLKGILLLLLAVFAAVGYGVTVKKLSLRYHGITIVWIQSTIAAIYLLPLFLGFEFNHFVTVVPDLKVLLLLFQLSLFGSVLAFILITYVISRIGLNNANIFTNLIPMFTALISYFILKEYFDSRKVLGMLIVLSGLFLSQLPALRLTWSKKHNL